MLWREKIETDKTARLGVSDNKVGNRLKAIKKLWFSKEGWTALQETNWLDVTEYIERNKYMEITSPWSILYKTLENRKASATTLFLYSSMDTWLWYLLVHCGSWGGDRGKRWQSFTLPLQKTAILHQFRTSDNKAPNKRTPVPHSAVSWSILGCCMQWNAIFKDQYWSRQAS